jgi:hypothetical protein
MQQRRLRLGDILDDYCPRERRITNHVIVAMIEDDVRQTRCSTCDAEHEYKQGKAPVRRKKAGAVSQDIPEDARPPRAVAPALPIPDESELDEGDDIDVAGDDSGLTSDVEFAAVSADAGDEDGGDDDRAREDDGPVHRRLIRATLPRPEGQAPEWKEPEFTIRQPGREANGNRPGQRTRGHRPPMRQAQGPQGGQNRFGGQRHGTGSPRHGSGAPGGSGQGQGQGQGNRPQGNRPGQPASPRNGGGRPGGQNRGPGRKRGR